MTGAAGETQPDRARDTLLAHLRHELRTPVNAILGYSEMLLEDQPPASVRPDLEKIQAAGRALLALINEILDPARFRATDAGVDLEAAGARIRHDLRTPVNAILGYSEMLIEDSAASGQDVSVDDLKRIHVSVQKLLMLIDDIGRLSTGGSREATQERAARPRRSS